MDRDFEIRIGDDNIPYQTFNGKKYKLYPNRRYFTQHKHHMHHVVWEFYKGKRKKGFHIHHKDGNSWNNKIENLDEIRSFNHLSEHAKSKFKNKEWAKLFHEKGIEASKTWHKSEEGLQWHREHAIKNNFGKNIAIKRKCDFCEKEYIAKSKHGKFCHPNCKASNLRKRKRMERGSL
jgi:hypothetical protein